MDDLISRQAAIAAFYTRQSFGWTSFDIIRKIKSLPSAQPERKTGQWILVKGSNGKDYHKCSCCLHTQEITGIKNYCSVCGADMMEVEHE